MEALLKLIVGVDGVTAEMLVQLSYIYLATELVGWAGITITILGLVAIICKTVRYGIDKAS